MDLTCPPKIDARLLVKNWARRDKTEISVEDEP
jgi:hypothetical protein